jgi:hypothetical protein
MRNLLLFKLFFSKWSYIISFCFQDCFVFSFQTFDYNVSWHRFLWIYFVWSLLNFLSHSFVSFAKYGKFSAMFLQIFFSLIFFLLSFYDLDGADIRLLLDTHVPCFPNP